MKKRLLTLALALVMALSLAACGGSGGDSQPSGGGDSQPSGGGDYQPAAGDSGSSGASGSVYYLNFKPEQDGAWQELAKAYTQETGVEVKVQTAASGQYETTLMSEIAKTDAPTLFQVNGPVGLANWRDYCYDLSGSAVAGELSSPDFALMDGGSMSGIAYVIETYGLIYNKALLEQAGYSADDIKSFADLKKVAEDITARKDELGFSAFTSAGMDGSSDWRFKTHLANLPIYFEYEADGIGDTEAIKGTYLDNYRAIWDLYINNCTCAPTLLSAKTGDDSVAEFLTEQAVFYQNGTWAFGDVADVGEENLGMLPIYFGVGDEANQGLCTGTENYWCVNKNANPEDIQATLDFMYWCVTSDTGLDYMCSGDEGRMGFVIPFKGNLESTNALVNIANDYVAQGTTSIKWCFPTMPSEEWKNVLGSALTAYAADQTDANLETVRAAFVDNWAAEKSK